MSKIQKLFEKALNSPQSLRIEEVYRLAEAFGFHLKGGKGSHRVYSRPGIAAMLNFQNVGGFAKPYQVKQLLKAVEDYGLKLEE